MIKLRKRGPKWLTLGCGVRVKTKPMRFSRYLRMYQKMAEIAKDAQAVNAKVKEMSGGVLDADDTPTPESLVMLAFANELIVEWRGVGDDDGNDAPVTPEYIALFCENMATGPAWWNLVQTPLAEIIAEGEDSAAEPSGTSASAAHDSAPGAAATTTSPASPPEYA